jgi:hypothetical protein
VDTAKLKLPWKLVEDTDPGCSKCASDGALGVQIRNRDDEVVLDCGHETIIAEEFDLQLIVDAINAHYQPR